MPNKSRVSKWATTRSLAEMDVVYTVGNNPRNEELRFSLRSLVNFPHRQVWLTGCQPPWLAKLKVIRGNEGATKEARIYNSVLAAAKHPEVSDQFVLFNDDFFVTAPVSKLPPTYLLSLRKHIDDPHLGQVDSGWGWKDSMIATLDLLESRGIKTPLSYESHIPMVFDKKLLAQVMQPYVSDHPPQLRSLYGNLAGIGGEQRRDDAKVIKTGLHAPIPTPFFSTHPPTFAEYKAKLKEMFPVPTEYEKAGAAKLLLGAAIARKLTGREGTA